MTICDETPRPTGRTDHAVLTGNRYAIELSGNEMTRQGWEGSEYTERVVDYHWFEGEASLKRLAHPRARPAHFLFEAPGGKLTNSLFLVGIHDLPLSRDCNEPDQYLVSERRAELVDQICEVAFADYRSQLGKQVPRIRFSRLDLKALIASGLAYGSEGQVELRLNS